VSLNDLVKEQAQRQIDLAIEEMPLAQTRSNKVDEELLKRKSHKRPTRSVR